PIPKFAQPCSETRCELRNRRTLANIRLYCRPNPKFAIGSRQHCANFGFAAIVKQSRSVHLTLDCVASLAMTATAPPRLRRHFPTRRRRRRARACTHSAGGQTARRQAPPPPPCRGASPLLGSRAQPPRAGRGK